MEQHVPIRAAKKALDVLDLVIEAGISGKTASFASLVERLAMPRSSVHNLVKTLVACGYAERSDRGVYVPGYKCRQLLRLGRLGSPEAAEAISRALRRYGDAEHETCMLVILVNGERVMLCFADCERAVCVSQVVVERRTFFEKPTGRMLAAIAGEAELREILDRQGFPGPLWNNINDEASLRAELSVLQDQGYAYSIVAGSDDGYATFACPVAAPGEHPWGVVGTYVPLCRCSASREKQVLAALRRMADQIAAAVPELVARGATSAV